jgi:hypothetical protein
VGRVLVSGDGERYIQVRRSRPMKTLEAMVTNQSEHMGSMPNDRTNEGKEEDEGKNGVSHWPIDSLRVSNLRQAVHVRLCPTHLFAVQLSLSRYLVSSCPHVAIVMSGGADVHSHVVIAGNHETSSVSYAPMSDRRRNWSHPHRGSVY